MKSVLSDKCCEKKEKPFPKLMISGNGKLILFFSPMCGVVLAKGLGDEPVGHYDDDYAMGGFKDYEGDVCLTNS